MDWTALQDELRQQLKARQGARSDVARRQNVRPSAVSRYVSGGHLISAEHLNTILGVLDLELVAIPRRQATASAEAPEPYDWGAGGPPTGKKLHHTQEGWKIEDEARGPTRNHAPA